MARYKHFYVLLILVVLAVCANLFAQEEGGDPYARQYLDIVNIVRKHYVKEKTQDELFEAAMTGMVSSLDKHSQFMKQEDITDLQTDISGELEGGIGIEYNIPDTEKQIITVITPLKGSPAYEAGIFAGDEILKVNGEDVTGKNSEDVVNKLRGTDGSEVELTILRGGTKTLVIPVVRKKISISSVRGEGIIDEQNKIGYLRVRSFQYGTPNELKSAIDALLKQGMKALILDLRNNPGGTLQAGEDVANLFIKKGIIVSIRGRAPEDVKVIEASSENSYDKKQLPMVVLVDGGTASSSEIVSGALQDHKRALLIGTQTYGKGSVQSIFNLDRARHKYALRLTIAKYYTPSGRCIHRENSDDEGGLTPDIVIDEKTLEENKEYHQWWSKRWIEFNRSPESKAWHDEMLKKAEAEGKPEKNPEDPFIKKGLDSLKSILNQE